MGGCSCLPQRVHRARDPSRTKGAGRRTFWIRRLEPTRSKPPSFIQGF